MPVVTMKQLLESGVHFGHQTRRWDPKMKPYIFTERNGIYILDLEQTLELIDVAYRFVRKVASEGRPVLFVGTKKQAQETVESEAARCEMPYVNSRWLGGTLTNFVTIKSRIDRLKSLEKMEAEGEFEYLPKKEGLELQKERSKLSKNFEGLKSMNKLPGAVFVIDPRKERIPVLEARRLEIPLVAMVDTNCDPNEIDYVIPSNDDAIRAIALLSRIMANAALEGRETWELEKKSREAEAGEQKPKAAAGRA
ncbi:MAG: 30S ribosomal protein S2 [Terriglobia bacterium]